MTEVKPSPGITIVPYHDCHHAVFKSLNEEWITRYFALEERDRNTLNNPVETILDKGGYIFMAAIEGNIVGTCALIKIDELTFELAKMAVAPAFHGNGIGYALGKHCIETAKRYAIKKLTLLSNTKLAPAISLYKKLGFVETPIPETAYQRANIHMEIDFQSLVKASVIVADDLPLGLAMNATSLVTASLGHKLKHLIGNNVIDGDGDVHAGLTWLPIAILKGTREEIAAVRKNAFLAGMTTIDVPALAQATRTYAEYEKLVNQSASLMDYLALGLYGDRNTMTKLTRKFSLYK